MKIELDADRYDQLQLQVLEHIVKSVRDGLREAGVDDDQILYEATGNLCFALCTIIDGSRQMTLEDQPVVPFLTFATERNSTHLIAAKGGSWMHEYVFGTVDEVFAAADEA